MRWKDSVLFTALFVWCLLCLSSINNAYSAIILLTDPVCFLLLIACFWRFPDSCADGFITILFSPFVATASIIMVRFAEYHNHGSSPDRDDGMGRIRYDVEDDSLFTAVVEDDNHSTTASSSNHDIQIAAWNQEDVAAAAPFVATAVTAGRTPTFASATADSSPFSGKRTLREGTTASAPASVSVASNPPPTVKRLRFQLPETSDEEKDDDDDDEDYFTEDEKEKDAAAVAVAVAPVPPIAAPVPDPYRNQPRCTLVDISTQPPLMVAHEPLTRSEIENSGCVITLRVEESDDDDPKCHSSVPLVRVMARKKMQDYLGKKRDGDVEVMLANVIQAEKQRLRQQQQKQLDEDVVVAEDLLLEWLDEKPRDTQEEMERSLERAQFYLDNVPNQDIWPGIEELKLWNHKASHELSLRNLTKLRRLLLPMSVQLVHWSSDDANKSSCIVKVKKSLIDFWLGQHGWWEAKPNDQHGIVLDADDDQSSMGQSSMGTVRRSALQSRILDRLLLMGILIKSFVNTFNKGSTVILFEYHWILRRILWTLNRAGGRYHYQGDWLDLDKLDLDDLPLPLEGTNRLRRSIPEEKRRNRIKVVRRREELWQEYLDSTSSTVATAKPSSRMLDGHVLVTEKEDGVSLDDFLRKSYFMEQVNAGIPRQFVPFRSRSRMEKVALGWDNVRKLRKVFFDRDGSLSRNIIDDVSTEINHHYISFTNETGCGAADKRWQIPIRLHSADSNEKVPTRARAERILKHYNVVQPVKERIQDLALLVGGTEDQSLHHDLCRQWTFWLPHEQTDETPTLGWEASRYAYNTAMKGGDAPSSLLIGMGHENYILLGVQNNQVEKLQDDEGKCRIKHGHPFETFDIVREDKNLVVLKVPTGCIFTGDFQHAGVRNVMHGSMEAELLDELNLRIASILEREFPSHEERTRAVVEMLCDFKGLDRLCRLHCSTEPKGFHMQFPHNAVGYTYCKSNEGTPEDIEAFQSGLSPRNSYATTVPIQKAGRDSSDEEEEVAWEEASLQEQQQQQQQSTHRGSGKPKRNEDSHSGEDTESEWEED